MFECLFGRFCAVDEFFFVDDMLLYHSLDTLHKLAGNAEVVLNLEHLMKAALKTKASVTPAEVARSVKSYLPLMPETHIVITGTVAFMPHFGVKSLWRFLNKERPSNDSRKEPTWSWPENG